MGELNYIMPACKTLSTMYVPLFISELVLIPSQCFTSRTRAAKSMAIGLVMLAPRSTFHSPLRTSEVIFANDPDFTGCGLHTS